MTPKDSTDPRHAQVPRQMIEDETLIERYVTGQLDPETTVAFEEAMLADPHLAEAVETAEALQAGLGRLALEQMLVATEPVAHPASGSATAAGTSPTQGNRRSPGGPWRWASAFAALLVVALGFGLVASLQSAQELESRLAVATAPAVSLPAVHLSVFRGEARRPSVELSAAERLTFTFDAPEPRGTFDLTLFDADNQQLWSGRQEADAIGRVSIDLHGAFLDAARYRVRIDSVDGGASAEVEFDIRRPQP